MKYEMEWDGKTLKQQTWSPEEGYRDWEGDAEAAEGAGLAAKDAGVQPDRPADAGADGESL